MSWLELSMWTIWFCALGGVAMTLLKNATTWPSRLVWAFGTASNLLGLVMICAVIALKLKGTS